MAPTRDEIGSAGEIAFCTLFKSGWSVTKTDRDRHGWDFLLESHVSDIHTLGDKFTYGEIKILCQIKSSCNNLDYVSVSCDNVRRMCESQIPFIVVAIELDEHLNTRNVRWIHIYGNILESCLAHLRKNSAQKTNKKLRIKMGPAHALQDSHRLIEEIRNCFPAATFSHYTASKNIQIESLGSSDRSYTGNFSFNASKDLASFIEMELGQESSIDISDFSIIESRFGIPLEIASAEAAKLSISSFGTDGILRIYVRGFDFPEAIIPAKFRTSATAFLINKKHTYRITTNTIRVDVIREPLGEGDSPIDYKTTVQIRDESKCHLSYNAEEFTSIVANKYALIDGGTVIIEHYIDGKRKAEIPINDDKTRKTDRNHNLMAIWRNIYNSLPRMDRETMKISIDKFIEDIKPISSYFDNESSREIKIRFKEALPPSGVDQSIQFWKQEFFPFGNGFLLFTLHSKGEIISRSPKSLVMKGSLRATDVRFLLTSPSEDELQRHYNPST